MKHDPTEAKAFGQVLTRLRSAAGNPSYSSIERQMIGLGTLVTLVEILPEVGRHSSTTSGRVSSMKRYRLITSTDPSGGCSEFSAMSDELAIDAARSMLYGSRIVSLVEVDLAAPSGTRAVEVKS